MNLLQIILAIISTACLLCFSVYIYLAYKGDSLFLYLSGRSDHVSFGQGAFLIFSAIGLLTCMGTGAEAMLFWIPESIGTIDEEGEYQALRISLASLFGFMGGFTLLSFIANVVTNSYVAKENFVEIDSYRKAFAASLSTQEIEYFKSKIEKDLGELNSKVEEKYGSYLRSRLSTPHPERNTIYMYSKLISLLEKHQEGLSQLKDRGKNTI